MVGLPEFRVRREERVDRLVVGGRQGGQRGEQSRVAARCVLDRRERGLVEHSGVAQLLAQVVVAEPSRGCGEHRGGQCSSWVGIPGGCRHRAVDQPEEEVAGAGAVDQRHELLRDGARGVVDQRELARYRGEVAAQGGGQAGGVLLGRACGATRVVVPDQVQGLSRSHRGGLDRLHEPDEADRGRLEYPWAQRRQRWAAMSPDLRDVGCHWGQRRGHQVGRRERIQPAEVDQLQQFHHAEPQGPRQPAAPVQGADIFQGERRADVESQRGRDQGQLAARQIQRRPQRRLMAEQRLRPVGEHVAVLVRGEGRIGLEGTGGEKYLLVQGVGPGDPDRRPAGEHLLQGAARVKPEHVQQPVGEAEPDQHRFEAVV